jgi:hypothetical protein
MNENSSNQTDQRHSSLRNAAILTACAGGAHAVLFLLALWLLAQVPGTGDSNEEVIAYYSSSEKRLSTLVGLYVMPFAGIAFLWFIVALRMWIAAVGSREDALLSNIQLVSGILYIGLLLTAAAANSVVAASVEFEDGEIDPVWARLLPQYGNTLLVVFALRMGGTFVLVTSRLVLTSSLLPRWFGYAGLLAGVAMLLTATLNVWLAVMFPTWMLFLSILLLNRARQIPVDRRLTEPIAIDEPRSSG